MPKPVSSSATQPYSPRPQAGLRKGEERAHSPPLPQAGRGIGGDGELAYRDIPGLCKAQHQRNRSPRLWSLNPERYVGGAPGEAVSDEDFKEKLEALNEELEVLNAQAREMEATIAANVAGILSE